MYFGVLRDLLEASGESLELAEGSTVGAVVNLLRERTSKQSELWRSLAVAVNREYAGGGTVLRDGDEVALLPPVSGGWGRVAQ